MTVRLLSLADVRAAGLSYQDAMQLVRTAYEAESQGRVDVPIKIGIETPRTNSFLDAMPAWVGAQPPALGMKWVSYFPGNLEQGRPDSTGLIVLNHPEHGLPVCIMEGMHITFLRTTASAAVMTRDALEHEPHTLGLVGCGGLGHWAARMFTAAFPTLRTIYVSSRTQASRTKFCQDLAREGDWEIIAVDEAADAVRPADIVVSSLPPSSGRPIQAEWLRPGAVFAPLDLIHSWHGDVMLQATEILADSPGFLNRLLQRHRPELAPHVLGLTPYQNRNAQAATGKRGHKFVGVCGIASTDVVLGWEVYRRAMQAGLGQNFDFSAALASAAASAPVQAGA